MTEYVHVYSDVKDLKKYELMEILDGVLRPSNENHFKGIKPRKVSCNRFIIIEKDIVLLNPEMEKILAEEQKIEESNLALLKLQELDLQQIRPIAEYIASKVDAPTELVAIETAKEAERLKIWV